LTFIGFFIIPMIIQVIFPKYLESSDAIQIMNLSLLPMSIVKIHMPKLLAIEKSRFILTGLIISLSVWVPTMIVFGTVYVILEAATSFVLATIIQDVYFFMVSKKLNEEDHIGK